MLVKDSEGRAFTVRCGEVESSCTLSPAAGSKLSEGAHAILMKSEGRLLGACEAESDSAPVHPGDCRPLRCERDVDCPPLHGPGTGSCLGKWCVDPAHAIGPNDAVMLCLAGTGVGHGTPLQVERYALGLNCGSPCVVPKPCQKP